MRMNCGLTGQRQTTIRNRCLRRAQPHVDGFGNHAMIYRGRIYGWGSPMTGRWEYIPLGSERATGRWTPTPDSFTGRI